MSFTFFNGCPVIVQCLDALGVLLLLGVVALFSFGKHLLLLCENLNNSDRSRMVLHFIRATNKVFLLTVQANKNESRLVA